MKAHFIFASITAYILFSERVFLRLSTGGRGILPILDLLILALAPVLALSSPASMMFLRSREFWKYWFPYILLGFLLPILGVLFNDYPARTVAECLRGVQILSFVAVGCWIGGSQLDTRRLVRIYLLLAIAVEFVFAAVQFGYGRGTFAGGIFDVLHQWDMASQIAYSERYILSARSIGTYLNPNTLGFWGAIALWSSLLLLSGGVRIAAACMAVFTLLASESRGSMMAGIASAVVWFVYILASRGADLRKARDASAVVLVLGLVGLTWSAIVFQDRIENVSPQNRFERGLRFLSEGAAADQNAAGRIGGWSRALRFHQDHLLGTMGEPRFVFRDIIDNDYVRALLQGSVWYVIAVCMALYGAFRQLTKRTAVGWLLGLSAVVIAINAMTAHPLTYSVTAIFWMAIGFYLYYAATAEVAERRLMPVERLPGRCFRWFVPRSNA